LVSGTAIHGRRPIWVTTDPYSTSFNKCLLCPDSDQIAKSPHQTAYLFDHLVGKRAYIQFLLSLVAFCEPSLCQNSETDLPIVLTRCLKRTNAVKGRKNSHTKCRPLKGEITMIKRLVMASLLGLTLASPAFAGDIKNDKRDIRIDEKDLHIHREELRNDLKDGASKADIANQKADIASEKADLRRDRLDLRRDRRDKK